MRSCWNWWRALRSPSASAVTGPRPLVLGRAPQAPRPRVQVSRFQRGAVDRKTDRGGARNRAHTADCPSRSETRKREGQTRRHRQGARFRVGRGVESLPDPGRNSDSGELDLANSPTLTSPAGMTRPGMILGARRLHESRAGARPGRRQAHGYLGVRVRPVRNAHRSPRIHRVTR